MGLGDFWLQSNNGKKISLDNLKELKKSDLKNNPELIKLFDIFNTNKSNGSEEVLDKQELNSLFNTFSKAAQSQKGKNTSIFETEEAEDFINSNSVLQESNIKTSDLFDFLSKIVKPQNEQKTIPKPSRKTKTNQEVKAGVIESLRSDSDETLKIISNMNNGDISDIYDSVKTFLDMDTSKAKVLEATVNQAQGAKYMEKAQSGGLTREEYIKANKQRLQDMMKARLYKKDKNGIDYLDKNRADLKMSRKEFEALMLATIERMTDDMDIKSVKEKMRQLPMTTENGDRFLMDSIKQNAVVLFGKAKSAGCSTLDLATKYIYDTTKIVKPNPDDKKLLTFDEVFYYEQGVNYSKEDCEKYLDAQKQLTKNLSSYNKYLEFKTGANKILKEKDAEKALNNVIKLFEQFYSDPSYPNLAYKNLKSVVKNSNLPINVTQDETGRISISMVSGSEDLLLSYASDILAAEGSIQQERLDKVFGGNAKEKLEELQKEVEQAHENAYGNDFSSTLGKAMIEDNQTFIQRYTGNASMTGMGLTVVGGVLCFTPAAALGAVMVTAGNTLAISGMAAESGLGFYEASTRKHGAEDGEYEELTKTMLMNLGGFGFGGAAGKTGMKLFNKFVSKELDSLPKLSEAFKSAMVKGNRAEALKIVCSQPEYRKQFAKGFASKLLSDFSISYAGDLVMMGVLDTQDDWESLLQSNLIGILAGMGGDIKDAAHLGMKGDKYRALKKKEQDGTITQKEIKELALLRQDADIRNMSGVNEGVNEGVNGRVDAESRKGVMQEERDVLHQKSMQDLQTELTLPDLFKACDKKFLEQETLKEGENIYTPEEKSQIQELYKKNSKVVAELLNLQANKNSYIYPENRFLPQMMQKMIEVSQKYPKLYEKLLKYDSNFEWIYRENIIQYFEQAYEKNSKLADELFDMKDSENEPRFFGENLLLVVQNIEKPQVRDFVYSKVLRNGKEEYAIESWQIRNYINKSLNDIEIKIMQLKTFDGKYNLFTSGEMDYVKSVLSYNPKCLNDIQNPKTSEKAKKELMIESHKIISNVLFEYPNLKDFLVNITPENTYSVDMNTKSSDGSFSFICYSNDITVTIRIKPNSNKGFDILSKESRRDDGNISHVWVEFADGRSQIEDIEYDTFKSEGKEFKVSKNLTKTLYDKYGEPIYQEKTIKTDNVLHAYNIEGTERANTPLKGIVKTNQTNNSETKITKEYTHLNGMKTISNIIQSERGIESSYRVVGRNGKTFIDTRRTHKKISENHYESSLNGQKYDIVLDVDKVVVSRLDKNGNKEETITLGSNILDPKLKELYKNLPGDYFFMLKKAGIKRVELFDGGSGVTPEGIVQISKDDLKNPFVLAHELGHVIDHALLNDLNNNHVLMQIFLKEFAKYQQSASYEEGKIIDYFTEIQDNAYEGVIGRELSYLQEIIAETHALYSGLSNDNSIIGMRGIELQKHFPETMTFVMKKFNHVYSQVNSGTLKQTTYEADVSVRKGITKLNAINVGQAVPDNNPAQKTAEGKSTSSKTDAQASPQHIVVGNKLFELNSKFGEPAKDAIEEVKAEIERLSKTEPEKADNLQIVLDMFITPTEAKKVTETQIDAVVNYLDEHYGHKENYLTTQVKKLGLDILGKFGHRMKGLESTRDKVANYIADAIKDENEAIKNGENFTPKTLLDAYNDVRDKYACRTVFEMGDYTKAPTVANLINEAKALKLQGKIKEANAKMHEAELEAAELQSKDVTETIKQSILKAKENDADLNLMRISNYVSSDGIPILSESQLSEIKYFAAQQGINVEFIRLASEIDPSLTPEQRKEQEKKLTTKSQPSGYTALQINFVTKTGEVIEWQFRGELVDKFAEAEHLPYDLRTGKLPWKQIPELEPLYKPIADLLNEDVMPKHAYKQINRYFTDYYTHLRRLELGFESTEPKLEDYENYRAKDENGVERDFSYKFDKRLEAKNLIALHDYAEGIKDGLVTPERAVVELNRIVAENSKQKENTNHEKAENNNINFSSFTEFLKESNSSYQIEIDKDGNKIIRIVSERNKKANGGIEFKYNVYKFDSNGDMIEGLENQTEAEIRNKFGKLKRTQIVDASGTNDNSTVLYSGIPVFALKNPVKGVKNYLRKKEVLKYFEDDKKSQQQAEYLLDRLMKNSVDLTDKYYGWTEYDIKICLSMANNCNNPTGCLDLIADIHARFAKNNNSTMHHCLKHFLRYTASYTKSTHGINENAFLNVLQGIKDNNFSDEQLYAIFNKGYDSKYWYYRDIPHLFTTQMWEHLANIMPALKELSPEQIVQLDIYTLIQITDLNRFNALKTVDKQNILKGIEGIPENVKQKMVDSGFDIKGIESMLKGTTHTTGYAVRTDKTAQKQFEKSFIVSEPKSDNPASQTLTTAETILGGTEFREFLNSYSDKGIPLKYSRENFVKDLNNLLEQLPENERTNVLKELNITLDKNYFTGFIKLNPFKTENYSQASQTILKQIRECADNFAKNNEVKCSNPEIKAILDDIVKGFPEFTSIMGRIDADHSNKLEIHILQTLNEAINNPKYKLLTNEEKKILKFAILLHDMGKAEGIGVEHATQSVVYARSILSKFNLNETMKNSIVNLVKYHHFTDGSQSFDFRDLFRTDSERKVAVLMAESDYSARFGGILNTDKYSNWQNKWGDKFNIWDKNTFRKPGNKIQTDNNTHIAQIAPKQKYILPNGQTVEIPVMDMRNAKPDEPASNYGWFNGKTLGETVSHVHNCSNIANVKTVLEAQLDPNMDMDLSTRARIITDRDAEYGIYQLVLSAPDSNIGGVFADNVGSGQKKGLGNFISSRYNKQTGYKGIELANTWMNEIHTLNPKVEQIAILADITPEQVPIEIVELSHRFKVPIIILGNRKR